VDKEENRSLKDINWREIGILVPLLIFIFWIDCTRNRSFDLMAPAVDNLVATLQVAALALH